MGFDSWQGHVFSDFCYDHTQGAHLVSYLVCMGKPFLISPMCNHSGCGGEKKSPISPNSGRQCHEVRPPGPACVNAATVVMVLSIQETSGTTKSCGCVTTLTCNRDWKKNAEM
jgi:hypothetical protein